MLSEAGHRNSQHVARFAAQPQLLLLPAAAVTRGFEAVAYPKLARELRAADPVVRSKAVVAARELMVHPQRLAQAIAAGVTPALVALLQDADAGLRREAAETARLLLVSPAGVRDLMGQHGGLPPLLALLRDASAAVRDAAYACLEAAAECQAGRAALAGHKGALAALVQAAREEEPGRAARALGVLSSCAAMRGNDAALGALVYNAAAVPALAELLEPGARPAAVRLAAARVLAALCSTRGEAVAQAVALGCVPSLVALAGEEAAAGGDEAACRAAAVLALANITRERDGKVAFVEAAGVAAVARLLERAVHSAAPEARDTHPSAAAEALLPLLHLAANVAELPGGRKQLEAAGVRGSLGEDAALAGKAAGEALRLLGFRHWGGAPPA